MSRRLPVLAALAAALLLASGCDAREGRGEVPPAAEARPAPPAATGADVLLVTIDTLRADAVGFSGNRRAETPVLDRLAAAGRVFTDAHAHNVVTLPSHTNILTGLYPYQHGVRDNSGFRLPPSVPTMATLLKAAGYATAAVVGAFPLDSRFGLGRGFDLYDDHYPRGGRPDQFVFPERRGDEVVRRGLAWWRAHAGGKRFLWVHLFDPHAPYDPPEPFASRFKDAPYLGEVAAADADLGPLLGPFLDGREKPAVLVVTGDHGESLGEHGEPTHGLFAYEPTLKVPLVVWGPGVRPGRDGRLARHVDILPTVLGAVGVAPPAGLPGRSLLQPPPAQPVRSYFEAMTANLNRGWAPLRGVIVGEDKAIELPLPELYDLADDPGEAHNLFPAQRRLGRELLARLPGESVWPPARRAAVSREEAASLRSLGYLTGSAPAKSRYGPEDDPKNLVALDAEIHRVIDLYSRGELAAAEKIACKVVAARPDMPLGYSHLAQVLLQEGRLDEAIGVMQEARRRGAASGPLLRQLALSLAQAGHGAEAVAILEPLVAAQDPPDPDDLNTLGLAVSEAGDQARAKSLLERSLSLEEDNPAAWETLSLVALRRERWAEARDAAKKALAGNDRLPHAWNDLGVALYYLGAREEAISAWQRAVAIDPRQYDTLYNLGLKAAEVGKVDVARRALARFIATAPAELYGPDIRDAKALLRRLGGS